MLQITEDYVSFETAKLLKDKGFDEYTFSDYSEEGVIGFNEVETRIAKGYQRPTLQMAMKWLREVHELFVHIGIYRDQDGNSSDYNYWNWWIDDVNTTLTIAENECIIPYETYEEACEAAIKYCLEHLI